MSQAQSVKNANTYDLFMGYLDVVNDALDKHSETPVVGDLVSWVTNLSQSKKIGAAVYDSDPKSPFDYFTVRIADGKVQLDSRGKNEPDIDWRVSQEFLVEVNENRQEYIDNPLKLDLEWLKSRVGLYALTH